jgi:hypothetical protein
VRRWARLTEEHSLDPVAKLVLMGDVMPPGAMRVMQRHGSDQLDELVVQCA